MGEGRKGGLIIGSVKSNIGHLEPASGIAGLIKLVLSLHYRQVPPNIHFNTPNPKIDFKRFNMIVPTEMTPLPEGNVFAGINSFGFGGANAHVVLQSAPPTKRTTWKKGRTDMTLFTLSARSEDALRELAARYRDYVLTTAATPHEIAAALAYRRTQHDIRLAFPAKDKESLADVLTAYAEGEDAQTLSHGRTFFAGNEEPVFVYSGQGPQWHAMGRELLSSNDVFRKTIEEVSGILTTLGWLSEYKSTLIAELSKDEATSRMNETEVAQPALFALQVALTRVWESLGIRPGAIVGHSIGEVAASYAAGALSLAEATRVVFARSRAQARAAGRGTMLAVGLSEEVARNRILPFLGKIDIAAINALSMVTLAGETDALTALSGELEKEGVFYRILRVDVPFHSHLLDDVREPFLSSLGALTPQETSTPLYSTVTGARIAGTKLTADYWYRNIREPVLFYPALSRMVEKGNVVFIEVGPHPILSTGIEDALRTHGRKGLALPTLRRKEQEMSRVVQTLAALYTAGAPLSREALFGERPRHSTLPSYAWQKERYWLETRESNAFRTGRPPHPHLAAHHESAKENGTVVWDITLDRRSQHYIADHRVQGPLVYPGAGHVDLAIACARASFPDAFSEGGVGFIEDMNFFSPLFLPDEGAPYKVQLAVSSDRGEFTIASQREEGGAWVPHSNGKCNYLGERFITHSINLEALRERITTPVDLAPMFKELADGGLDLGPTFKGLTELYQGEMESLGRIDVHPAIATDYRMFNIHPALLDASFQTAFGITAGKERIGVYIPVHIDRVKFYRSPRGASIWSYTKASAHTDENIIADVTILDEDGTLLAEVRGFVAQYLKGSKGEVSGEEDSWYYAYTWKMKSLLEDERERTPARYLATPDETRPAVEAVIASIQKTIKQDLPCKIKSSPSGRSPGSPYSRSGRSGRTTDAPSGES